MANLNTIIQRAREIIGNKVGVSSNEMDAPDVAITADLNSIIRKLSSQFASTESLKEVTFSTVSGTQDYDIETYVGDDVVSISEIYRSAQFTPDWVIEDGVSGTRTLGSGEFNTTARESVAPAGLQANVYRTIVDQRRAENYERFNIERVGDVIRLLPPPTEQEIVAVRYVSSAGSVTDLPTEVENALLYAACVSILNCILNRLGSSYAAGRTYGDTDLIRLKSIKDQRDYYKGEFREEMGLLTR